eukprot:TRINITY_DN2465_c0_g1_i1.p1 TRINITY_DN2465_c0_g1~~TRINITY_DN2465_c0_g1_i1.p1  ORF type:complete len:464 (-),score=97.94 TRINITY_DN2465_c0_g1_i1:1251-2642(-)
MTTFQGLPEEILVQICSYLDEGSLLNLHESCSSASNVSGAIVLLFNRYLRSMATLDYVLGKKYKDEGWSYESSSDQLIYSLFRRTYNLLNAKSLKAHSARVDLIGLANNEDFPQRRVTSFVVYKDKAYLSLNDSSVESRNLSDLSKCLSVLLQPFDGVFPDYVLTKGCQIHIKDQLLGAADTRRQKLFLWNLETEFILSEISIYETGFPYDLKMNSKNVFILSGFSLIVWRIDPQLGVRSSRPIVIPEFDTEDNWLERHSLQVSEDYVVTKSTYFEGPGNVNYIHIRRCGPDGFIGPIIRNITCSKTNSITDFCLSPSNLLVLFYSNRRPLVVFQRQIIEVMNISTGEVVSQIPPRQFSLLLPIAWIRDELYLKVVLQASKNALKIERWSMKSKSFGILEDITLDNIADLIHIGLSHVVKIFNEFPVTPHLENYDHYDYDEVSTFKICGMVYDLWDSNKLLLQ